MKIYNAYICIGLYARARGELQPERRLSGECDVCRAAWWEMAECVKNESVKVNPFTPLRGR